LCTPSIWHGVTTVLMGNCGLTLAPLRPEHRDAMLSVFCCVEDLPKDALGAVLPWNWETFDEYLDIIDQGLGLNMLPLVGHNPLRLSAMGEAAWERAATEEETATMQRLLAESMQAGAWGWSATVSPTHAGRSGEPVPSRIAENPERVALARTLGSFNRGVIEVLPPSITQVDEADQQHLLDLARTSQRPVFFLGFTADRRDYVETAAQEGAQLYALLRAIPFNRKISLKRTTFFRNLTGSDPLLLLPLLERRVEADTIALDGLRLHLIRTKAGQGNWEGLAGAAEPAPEEAPAPAPEGEGGPALAGLAVNGLKVADARITWDDRMTGDHLVISDFNLTSGSIVPGQPVDLETDFQIQSREPALTGQVGLAGNLMVDMDAQRYAFREGELDLELAGEELAAEWRERIDE
jgi:hypothetical protein